MAVRIGSVVEGSPYSMKFQADGGNGDTSLVLIGWIPAQGARSRSWALRIEPGQTGEHANTAPAAKSYYGIELEVDVPDDKGAGTLTVEGALGGTKVVDVSEDETYRLLIVAR